MHSLLLAKANAIPDVVADLMYCNDTNSYIVHLIVSKHGKGQPGRPPGAGQAEGEDPRGPGADNQHAGHRQQSVGAAAAAGDAAGAGPHQEPAAAEVQKPVHV